MAVLINRRTTAWTDGELKIALDVLQKIERCQNKGVYLPGELFEGHIRTHKRNSTELILMNEDGHVFLVLRPNKEEVPSEPYPGELHFPGVTHGRMETTEQTFERLRKREGVTFKDPILIALRETKPGRRGGRCLMQIFVAQATDQPTNPRGAWHSIPDIPRSKLVASHRTLILPALTAYLESKLNLGIDAYRTPPK